MRISKAAARLLGLRGTGRRSGDNLEEGGHADQTETVEERRRGKSRKFKIGTIVGGVILCLTVVKQGAGVLMAIEDIHDRGGLCSFDVVREVEVINDRFCPHQREYGPTPVQRTASR